MFGNTPLIIIEDDAALVAAENPCCARHRGYGRPSHSYREKVCLIQLSDLDSDYIVDPLKVTDMSPLGEIMADPTKVKVCTAQTTTSCP